MRFRGVGARLSLGLLVLVLGALTIVYLIVVPSLRHRLVNAKLSQLARAAPVLARQVPDDPFLWNDFAEVASGSANARVVLYDYYQPGPTLQLAADSHTVNSRDVQGDRLAFRAAQTRSIVRGTVRRDGDRVAEVAVPVSSHAILLLAASLHDSLGNVSLVRRRLIAAGGLALLVALLLGLGGAGVFARRIRRLERAADRIAGGDFDEPVVDEGADELGELAQAFERMRRQLAQLDNARREFIANASHELRTPLFSLGGFLELLAEEDVDAETRAEFLRAMREQVGRLTKLATELLDLSRLDAGRLRVEREEVDLAALVRVVADEFAAVAATRGHELECGGGEEVEALGDGERVVQIARILVENALLHTPAGTRVRISAASEPSPSLTVEDDGPGISSEHAEHVFERFYRIEGAQAAGSGLGLAIASELAELMGGRLELAAATGRTAFTLTLPAAAQRGRDSERTPPASLVP